MNDSKLQGRQVVYSLSFAKKSIRGGIRTRDLLLRRQTRYPLRYTDHAGETSTDL
jgi:hypothetical protein